MEEELKYLKLNKSKSIYCFLRALETFMEGGFKEMALKEIQKIFLVLEELEDFIKSC